MRLFPLILAILLVGGCSERQASAEGRPAAVIWVGQRWLDAEAVATRAGYPLHDAAGLAWQPGINGFYVRLAGDRELVVFRNVSADTVGALELVENASRPKAERAYQSRQSFALPRAVDGD